MREEERTTSEERETNRKNELNRCNLFYIGALDRVGSNPIQPLESLAIRSRF